MAQYKVPQDVEADDKLLGPFTFRQFIYLMVMGGSIALAVALFQAFPLLAIIPAPIAIFFAVLALPLKKDQPMETYLAAIVSFHLKPKKRLWNAGQRESTIIITAPKKVENPRTRDITGEEASTRLSFLANVIDTEGYAIRDNTTSPLREDFVANNADTPDMLDDSASYNINTMINREQDARRAAIVDQMRAAIDTANQVLPATAPAATATMGNAVPATGGATGGTPAGPPNAGPVGEPVATAPWDAEGRRPTGPVAGVSSPLNSPAVIKPQLTELAKNKDYSVATIAKEANRIEKKKKDKEVYVSLH